MSACNCPLCRRAAEALKAMGPPNPGAAFAARLMLRADLVRVADGTSPYEPAMVLRAASLAGLGGAA